MVPVGAIAEDEAKRRAGEIAQRARGGESLAVLGRELGEAIDPPPTAPTTSDALRDRFGGIVVQALARLEPGEVSDPVRAMDGYWVVRVVARESAVAPPLDEVIESVRQAWTQHEHDARLEDEIAKLRGEASIEIADPELAGANAAP
jgi:peptidyl-prolyl cis-trans isomerase C